MLMISDSLLQEVLLWSNHRARSADPDPGYGLTCREAVVFHQVTANQSACPAQTSCRQTDRKYCQKVLNILSFNQILRNVLP